MGDCAPSLSNLKSSPVMNNSLALLGKDANTLASWCSFSEKLQNMTNAKIANSDQTFHLSESAVQFDDVTKLGYPNLQPEYTLGNDVTGAFHDTEVADIGYAVTNTIESSNPDEFGTFGYDIPSLFKTYKHAFQLL